MSNRWTPWLLSGGFLALIILFVGSLMASELTTGQIAYLPVAYNQPTPTPSPTPTPLPTPTPPPGAMTEFRALWVSRFDWTTFSGADPAKIDEIVNHAADAGFNVIYFQVRGDGDALYTPGLEPWSRRLTGTLGGNPGWDPLALMIEKAHARGLQVHAYLNIYPIWSGCGTPPDGTSPRHFYYNLRQHHGVTGDKVNGLQWSVAGIPYCTEYQRVTPASAYFDDHILAVARDLVQRYDIDGIHLDHIRYAAANASYDPVSNAAYELEKNLYSREDWQRRQVNGTVYKFYTQIRPLEPDLWLSAAVWPIYLDYWGWGGQEGFSDYYQDSKGWLSGGYIDSISPMIYPAAAGCMEDSEFWTYSRWSTLAADFHSSRAGRYAFPGIGAQYCSFAEIANRINRTRELGIQGHAIFSYSGLLANGYFDDLRAGPYARPAVVPEAPWDR